MMNLFDVIFWVLFTFDLYKVKDIPFWHLLILIGLSIVYDLTVGILKS